MRPYDSLMERSKFARGDEKYAGTTNIETADISTAA
jgi:hypothetical protein